MQLRHRILHLLGAITLSLSAQPSQAGNLYPMENGGPRRENRSLSPSELRNPVHVDWMTTSCLPLGDPLSNPIILPDRVCQSFAKGVRCYDRNSGQRLWTWMCDASTNLWNAPCYDPDRDRVYVGCFNGDLVALDASNGQVVWSKLHNPYPWPAQRSSPTYYNGKIYAGDGSSGFYCLDPDTRTVLWNFDFSTYFGTSFHDATTTPAFDNGEVYLSTFQGTLWRLDAATGAVQWYQTLGFVHEDSLLLADEYVYILGKHSQVQCRSRQDGSLVWQADTHTVVGDTNGCLALCGDMLIVPGDSWKVWGLNRHTGNHCWTTTLTGNFALNSPFVSCGKVYISACHGDFYSLDGATGQIEWRLNHGVEYTFVGWAEADGQLYVAKRNGDMICFKSDDPGDPADCLCNLAGVPPVGYIPSPVPTSIPRPVGACYPENAPTATATSSPTATDSPTRTFTPTPTPSGTWSPIPTDTETQTPTQTPTPSGTWSPIPTDTETQTPTQTPTPSGTWSPIPTDTATETPSATPTGTWSPILTDTPTPIWTSTLTSSPTATPEKVCDPRPYPNPCHGGPIQCRVGGGPYDRVDLKIFTTGCRKMREKHHNCTGSIEEDVTCEAKDDEGTDLANGLYYLEVDTEKGGLKCKYVRKLVIQR